MRNKNLNWHKKWAGNGLLLIFTVLIFGFKETPVKQTDRQIIVMQDSIPAQYKYTVPKELLFTGKREKDDYPGPLYPKFYPIGWSKDGKFAYVEEPADEACGCYFFNLIIRDMKTNSTIWRWDFEGKEGGKENIQKIWSRNSSMFSKQLQKAKIIPNKFQALHKLPARINGESIEFGIKNALFYSNDWGMEVIKTATILKTSKHVVEVVSMIEHATKTDAADTALFSITLANTLQGYLKSPYENRIALFYQTEDRGWEGPPNVIKFELFGSGLAMPIPVQVRDYSEKFSEAVDENGFFIYQNGNVQNLSFTDRMQKKTITLLVDELSTENKLFQFLSGPEKTFGPQLNWFVLTNTNFETGKQTLTKPAETQLKNLATLLNQFPAYKINIGTYSDQTGNAEMNLLLTRQRAAVIKEKLIAFGLATSRIKSAKGYGGQFAMGDQNDPVAKAKDRHSAIQIVE